MASRRKVQSVTVPIASAAATSTAIKMAGRRIAGIVVPSVWTAADISFEIEKPVGTWIKVVDQAGALVKLTGVATAASEYQMLPEIADRLVCDSNIRLVSTNTASEVNINQDAARSLIVELEEA
mgnify:FL=1